MLFISVIVVFICVWLFICSKHKLKNILTSHSIHPFFWLLWASLWSLPWTLYLTHGLSLLLHLILLLRPSFGTSFSVTSCCLICYFNFYVFDTLVVFTDPGEVVSGRKHPVGPRSARPLGQQRCVVGCSLPGPVDLSVVVSWLRWAVWLAGLVPSPVSCQARPVWRLLAAGWWDRVLLCPTRWLQGRKHSKHHGHLPTTCCSIRETLSQQNYCACQWERANDETRAFSVKTGFAETGLYWLLEELKK